MRANNVLGLVFANVDDSVLSEVTGVRSMASVPFGGGYRLIDFVLSNMVNAGMTKVGVITNNNYQSLMDHIGGGKPWDLARKNEGLYLLPPFNAQAIDNYNAGRIGALKNIMRFLERSTEEYVLLTDCTYVANLDFNDIFKYHQETEADITILCQKGKLPVLDSVLVVDKRDDERITKLHMGDTSGKKAEYCLKCAVMKKSLLERLVNDAFAKGHSSFEKEVFLKNVSKLKINGYKVDAFCPVIDSLESYYEANFSLLDVNNYKQLFNTERPVYTKVYEDMPVVYGLESCVKSSLVADGSVIDGTVENCIIFRDCHIEKGAVVKNSILMPHSFVGENAKLNYCITDKGVSVRSGKNLSGADSFPVYIGKNIHI